MLQGNDRELYIRWLLRAIEWRDKSRLGDERLRGNDRLLANLRKTRRGYMRFWARMAVHHTDCTGPIR